MGRMLGALMAFVLSGLSVIFLPLLAFWKLPVYFGMTLGLPSIFFFSSLCLWGAIVAVASLTIGFRAGIYDTMDIFNVLWKTGDSYDPAVHQKARQIKKIVVGSTVVTLILLCLG